MKRLGKVVLFVWMSLWSFGSGLYAFEPFVVEDIRVEGLQRISAGTVFTYLSLNIGDQIDAKGSAGVIQDLYKTGFFKDVTLRQEGKVLVIDVVERPTISKLTITGNEDFETEELQKNLKNIGISEGEVFNRSVLDRLDQELQRQYFSFGKYSVKINTTVTPLPRNRVAIDIAIVEGEVARIRKINIVGANAYTDKELKGSFQLGPPDWISWYSKRDRYSKQKLQGDLEMLRSYYLDRGYVNFNINSTQVAITPNKQDVYITINITEGDKYRVKGVKLAGDLVVPAAELFPSIVVNAGDIFNRKLITTSSESLTNRLGDEGYAFANVNTIPNVDEKSKEVTITFFVDPGRRVYVRRINMLGNARTEDEVLRREMRQMEGAWFSTGAVERSKTRLDRLGFFEDVTVETPAVPEVADQVDVNYSVTERPSGSLQAGLGYSQTQGFLVNASVSQENFLGTGNRFNVAFNNSDVNTLYSFSFNDPYYTMDGISRGYSAFYRQTDAAEANLSDYNQDAFGGNLNFGIPVGEFDSVRFAVGARHTEITATAYSPQEVLDFLAENGDAYDTIDLSTTWSHDTRNRLIFPNSGLLQRISLETTIPGVDLEYYKARYTHARYLPLTKSFTMALNADLGYGTGYGNLDTLPFFENYFAGGPKSLRGYQENTLGPIDSNGNPIGGTLLTLGGAELIFPVPYDKLANSLRLSTFVDGGNVYADTGSFDVGDFRYSAGASVVWLSPLGALSFSLAKPFNDQLNDQTQVFQFQLGSAF